MRTDESTAEEANTVIRKLVCLAVVFGLLGAWTRSAEAASEGCTVAGGKTCSYRAKTTGGIVATGNIWRVEILRKGKLITYGPDNWTTAGEYTVRKRNAVRKGDEVYVSTGDTVHHAISFAAWPPTVFAAVGVGPDYNR